MNGVVKTAVFLFVAVLSVGVWSSPGSLEDAGTAYYVGANGNDSNPGTETQPFATIQRAANVVNPGDSVVVEDGTYTGMGLGTDCASSTSRPVVCLTRGGTSAAWVTFRARYRLGARIDGQANSSTDGFRFLAKANYIRIEGFDVFGMGNSSQSANGFDLGAGGENVVIAQNEIHQIGRLCTDTSNGLNAVFVRQSNVTITQNTIHDIGRFSPGENGCAPKTEFYKNHDHGVYVAGGTGGVSVVNNVFYNHEHGWPIHVHPNTVTNLSILHNTFAFPNPYQPGHIILAAPTRDVRIINNIFLEPTTAAIYFFSGLHSNLTIANNLSSHGLATSTPTMGITLENNLEYTDPQLAPIQFRLQSTSPAIDRGTTLADVPVDIFGAVRPVGAASDMGAHEFGSPATPQRFRIIR